MKKIVSIISKIFILSVLIGGAVIIHRQVTADIASAGNVKGFAWSDNIGWISFNCADTDGLCLKSFYGVNINPTTGAMSGYAWSDNVGWLSFNAAHTAACPDGANCSPHVDVNSGEVSGYARFCAGTVSKDCKGASREDGWEGWVKLSELGSFNFNSPEPTGTQGVTFDATTKSLTGYAWGGDVVGWIQFTDVDADVNQQTLFCDAGGVSFAAGTTITRYKYKTDPNAECESYIVSCEATSPTEAQWTKSIQPILDNEYPVLTCGSSNLCPVEENNPCDIRNFITGTNISSPTLACGESLKFYKKSIVTNNTEGTITCDDNGNSAIRTCVNGILQGGDGYNKLICRVNPYQKER